MTLDTNNNSQQLTYTEKLSLSATMLSTLYVLPAVSEAAVVHVTSPLTLSIEDARAFDYQPVDWDVDGDSVADFRMEAFRTIVYSSSAYGYGLSRPYGSLQLNSNGLNGQGMVQNTGDGATNLRNLTPGETIGAALDTGRQWSPGVNRNILTSSSYFGFPSTSLFDGSNLIGFRFADGGHTLFGWAVIYIDEALLEMTIQQWAYEDSGGGIQAGQISSVPLPPSALMMLSGLALGAGGVLRGRKVRKAAQEQVAARP